MASEEERQVVEATRKAAAAFPAGGVVAALEKPLSMKGAMVISNGARSMLFPERGDMRSDDWERRHDPSRLYRQQGCGLDHVRKGLFPEEVLDAGSDRAAAMKGGTSLKPAPSKMSATLASSTGSRVSSEVAFQRRAE